MNAPAPTNGTNQHTLDTLLDKAKDLGEQAGKGRDTQVKFLLSCVEGGYYGAVDLTPGKHGAEVDDATKLAEAYVQAQGLATTFDHRAGNQRKLISTCRTAIKLGAWPKAGNGEPLATVGQLIAHRQKLRNDPTVDKKRLDDAANTLLRYARAQLKRDTLIDGDELNAFAYKTVPDPKTTEDKVESIRNSLQALVKGNGGFKDASPKVQEALTAMTDRLVEIAKSKAQNKGV